MEPGARRLLTGIVIGLAIGAGVAAVLVPAWLRGRAKAPTTGPADAGPALPPPAYHAVARWPVPVQAPRALAVDRQDRWWVGGQDAVVALDDHGQPAARWPVPAAVTALAVDPTGNLLWSGGGEVGRMGLDGQALARWRVGGSETVVTGLAATADRVYVAVASQRQVLVFSAPGERLGVLERSDLPAGQSGYVVPSPHFDVAAAPDGTVWVTDPGRHQLVAFTPAGAMVRAWGVWGTAVGAFSGCCNPTDVAVLSDGRLVTSEKGLVRVCVFTADGRFESLVTGPKDFAADAAGLDVAVDARGRVGVLEPAAKIVHIYINNN